MKENRHKISPDDYGCPVGCKYCVISKVDSRRDMWNKETVLGLNKAVTIFNPPLDLQDKEALHEFYNFPVDLLKGDFVGFNAISDPFWPKYEKELNFFLDNVPRIAKIATCVTKFNPSDAVLDKLSKIKNFRLVVSVTGLDSIENIKTEERLILLERAKKKGIKAFPIIHPYIAGMSDLSFLSRLKEIGYEEIDVKGLRYNHKNMSSWMPQQSQFFYEKKEEKEVLPEDGWRECIASAGLKLRNLKDWYREDFNLLQPKLERKEAELLVDEILKKANITSSDSDAAVIEEAIRRRM
jgi:DNA repair photolyase